MASIATDVTFSIRKLSVDFARHRQHHSRSFLLGIIVTGEIALHVTEGASLTERSRKSTHRHLELFRSVATQNLQILRRSKRIGAFSTLFLGAETNRDEQQHNR